jgi:putative ABC transport system ATP-binding protein
MVMTMADTKEVLIRCAGLKKTFKMRGEMVQALKGVDLELYRGEYVSIMGPSGSGKSTLFNMIGGLDTPTEGRVEIDGINLPELDSRKRAFVRCSWIGYIFQSFNLIPVLTALQNVAMPIVFSGVSKEEAESRANELLKSVGLGARVTHKPGELSGGQQQRVAIARALANGPSIILADEPTGNLDLKTGEDIINILSGLSRDKGVTVITATHDHKMLAASDRVVWVSEGMVQRIVKREELTIKVGTMDGH